MFLDSAKESICKKTPFPQLSFLTKIGICCQIQCDMNAKRLIHQAFYPIFIDY